VNHDFRISRVVECDSIGLHACKNISGNVPEPGAAVTLAKTTATVTFLSDSANSNSPWLIGGLIIAVEDVKPKMLKDSLRNLTK
jgi:hypothetical protein